MPGYKVQVSDASVIMCLVMLTFAANFSKNAQWYIHVYVELLCKFIKLYLIKIMSMLFSFASMTVSDY